MKRENLEEVWEMYEKAYAGHILIDTKKYKQTTYYHEYGWSECKYCKRGYDKRHFRNKAHLIPKLLGSKYLLSKYECDECNARFKLFESDLANFIGIIRSISGITGKSQIPKYKDKEKQIFQSEDGVIQIVDKDLVKQLENGEKIVKIEAIRAPHVLLNVYKALLKIGLAVMDKATSKSLRPIAQFILEEDDKLLQRVAGNLYVSKTFIPGSIITNSPILEVHKRKNRNFTVPEYMVRLHLRNVVLQYYLPFNPNDGYMKETRSDFPLAPTRLPNKRILEYGDVTYEWIEMSSTERIRGNKEKIGLRVDNLRKFKNSGDPA